jgi:hypothetical protein
MLTSCKLSSCDWKVGFAPNLKPHSVPSFVLSEPEECDGFFGQNIGKSAGVVELTGICKRRGVSGIREGKFASDDKEIVCLAYRKIEVGASKQAAVSSHQDAVVIEGYLDWCDRGIRSNVVGVISEGTGEVSFTIPPHSTVLGPPELADWEESTVKFTGKFSAFSKTISGNFSYVVSLPGRPPLNPGEIAVDVERLPRCISHSRKTDGASILILKEDAKKSKHLIPFNIKPYITTCSAAKRPCGKHRLEGEEDSAVDCIHLDEGSHWFEWTVSCTRNSVVVGVCANDAVGLENGEYVSMRNGIYDNSGFWSYYQPGNLSNGQEKVERSRYVDGDVVGININTEVGEISFYRNNEFVYSFKNLKLYVPSASAAGSENASCTVGFRPVVCLSRPGDVVVFHGPKHGPIAITYPEKSFADNRSQLIGTINNGAVNGIAAVRFYDSNNIDVGFYRNGLRHGPSIKVPSDSANLENVNIFMYTDDSLVTSIGIHQGVEPAGLSCEDAGQVRGLLDYVQAEFIEKAARRGWTSSVVPFQTHVSLLDKAPVLETETAEAVSTLQTIKVVVKGKGRPDMTFTMFADMKLRYLCAAYCDIFGLSLPNVRFTYASVDDLLAVPGRYQCGEGYAHYVLSVSEFLVVTADTALTTSKFDFDLATRRVQAVAGTYEYDFTLSADCKMIESGLVTQTDGGKSWRYGTGENELLYFREEAAPKIVDVDASPTQLNFVDGKVIEVGRPSILKATDKEGVAHLLKTSTAPYILQTLLSSGATVRSGVEIEDNPQVRMLEFAEVVEAYEFTRTREGIGRYRIADGWISERLRGGNEETVVSVLRQVISGTPREYRVIRSDGAIIRCGAELESSSLGFCPCGTTIRCSEMKSVIHEGIAVVRVKIISPEQWAGGWASAKENILELLTSDKASSGKAASKGAVDSDAEVASELLRRTAVRAERAQKVRAANPASASTDAFMVEKTINGTIDIDADNFFLLSNTNKLSNVNFSADCRTITCTGSNRVLVLGTRGFTRGLHYWEVQIDGLGSWGSLFIGVAPAESTQWNHGYGLINYRATQAFGTETIYGSYYAANDVVGVLLDMDHGTISYFKDGDNIGKSVVINMGVAYHNLRRNGVSRSSSNMLFPCFGMKSSGDKITIKRKWVSSRGLSPSTLLEHLLNAKSVVSRWRASYFTEYLPHTRLSPSLVEEMYHAYLRWRGHDEILVKTRAGTEISIDTSKEAITKAAGSIGEIFTLREGTRFRSAYGEGVIVGARIGQVWFTLDNNDTGAWYWTESELSDVVSNGIVTFDDTFAASASATSSIAVPNPRLSAEQLSAPELKFSEFAACLEDSHWSIQEDKSLVRLVNDISDKCNLDALRVPPQLLQSYRYTKVFSPQLAVLPNRTNQEVEVRYAALCVLNRAASIALPFCDMATVDNRIPLIFSPVARAQFPSYTCNRLLHPEFTFAKASSSTDILDVKTVIFSRIKFTLWDRALTETTTSTSAPPDEFERPDDLREYKINRPESLSAEAKVVLGRTSFHDRLRSSIFGQLLEMLRNSDEKALRRSFVHVEDAGQRRSFFVKFVGEGVDDHGGPYRAVFQAAVGEEPSGILNMLVPCPNSESESGENRDKYVINKSFLWQPTKLPLYSHLGMLMGIACRHKITVPFAIPALLWKSFVCEEADCTDLEAIDGQFVNSLNQITVGSEELDFVGELLTEQLLAAWGLPAHTSESVTSWATSSTWGTGNSTTSAQLSGSDGPRDDMNNAAAEMSFAAAIARQLVFGQLSQHIGPQTGYSSSSSLTVTQEHAAASSVDTFDLARTGPVCSLIKQIKLTSQQEGINSLLRGISGVVPTELLALFTVQEVEQLFCGQPDMDVELLKSMTIYDSVQPTDRFV